MPNCDESAFPDYLALLDRIAAAVKQQTVRSWRLFKLKPQTFNHSENVYRVLTMEHVFRTQFGIKYDPVVRDLTANNKPWMSDDSSELFIHGLLSSKRTGTCSSLPTFAIAVGRRLGYPLKLILVPNHTLYRWDDGKEIFNLQPHEAGGDVKPDEFFHTWPRKWTENDFAMNERTKVWLHSYTPKREVSKFLCNRALMLRDFKRWKEAMQAIEAAGRFDPGNPALDDIRYSIEFGVDGGDVRELVENSGPDFVGSPRDPVFSPIGSPITGLSRAWNSGMGSLHGITLPVDPACAAKQAAERRREEEIAFSDEHYRLVNLINESNRNRSPQHPDGNPPSGPLHRQLNELLQRRHRKEYAQ